MTAESIRAGKGGGYARYLEAKTVIPERGDYYLTPTGEPAQAPGRWLANPDTLASLAITSTAIDGPEFIALMEGRHPDTGEWLRAEGAGGGRGGGIDLTFSAPKSVSTIWALGTPEQRRQLEAAHAAAVSQAITHLTENIATVRRRHGGQVIEEHATDLLAAEYRHTTARGTLDGDVPDPQLHSHVVITSALRQDGRLVAVASRPLFRAARELGAYYRSALAHELTQHGYNITPRTGKHARYFEIAGVPRQLLDAFSQRSREVARAAERFRALHGRPPERGELRSLKLENRAAKTPATTVELHEHWRETAARHPGGPEPAPGAQTAPLAIEDRVEQTLTEHAATFTPGEFRAAMLEQTVGALPPDAALHLSKRMIRERRVLPLEGGLMTTLAQRAREQKIERQITRLAQPSDRDVGERARDIAAVQLAQQIGGELSHEQHHALRVITGPEQVAVLIGPAGTGKGVVIDAAARAEQQAGRETLGVAVAGSTAQRLGQDSPALAGHTLTVDALIARAEHGSLNLGSTTTIYFDEAGMGDTSRLAPLTDLASATGAKLVLIGDGAQLPAIGAGGMFERLTSIAPTAELTDIRRTLDLDEQRAWGDLRAGRSDRAMAHYHRRGRLHITDTRDQALERAVTAWAKLTQTHDHTQVALISDASNQEINRLNARAQHHRAARGELGELELPIPGVHYGIRAGDRIALIAQHHQPGQPRIENGARGDVLNITPDGELLAEFDSGQQRTLAGDELAKVRLGYAQHIHRAQGATVERALILTGGWQTSKEPAYVEASRARHGTDWYVSRHDLGTEGQDAERIKRLAQQMRQSRAQTPSLHYTEIAATPEPTHDLTRSRRRLPNLARLLTRLARHTLGRDR
jgi:conjugative relaxase-like TrwC/TraI family protein